MKFNKKLQNYYYEIKYICLLTLRNLLKIFYILPIKKNRILFLSYNGRQYSCNPKYIYLYLKNNYNNKFELIWPFNNPEDFKFLISNNTFVIKKNTLKYFYYLTTSKVIISNNNISTYFPIRKNQYLIYTWHGGGDYKKIGIDIGENKTYKIRNNNLHNFMTKLYLSSSKKFSEDVIRHALGYTGEIANCGMPRNDIFFNNHNDIECKVRKYYDLSDDTKVLLYAPTHRDDKPLTDYHFDYENVIKALKKRFSGNWVVMFRAHYSLATDFDKKFSNSFLVNASSYPDMQELLCVSDVLVTDYSSSIWDFSFTAKPCFLYATDVDLYKRERQFYMDINEWPFPLSESNEELIKNIENFNQEKYNRDVLKHYERLGNFESGHASEEVSDIIYNVCYKMEGR